MKNLQIDCDINSASYYGLSDCDYSMCEFSLLVSGKAFSLAEWLNTDGTLEQVDSHIKINQSEIFAQVVGLLDCTDEELWDALNAAACGEMTA